ncbi:YjfB family protein [Solimicrobium silvestre]|uniref:Putative motility protein n=1 Tax=Solimicrobium silvestre TaxID=2099400 RepID=A0A2S9GYH6_9BURK|nr:YjfB family protein [Solimicrobium silvestre]PRC92750.1 putative motility protein [Solimicrobium silvestre]
MDLAAVANGTSNNISDAGVSQTVALDVLKQALNIDQESATALIQAIPQSPTVPNLPANLGNHVNTTA